jgi:hypothetical protein
MGRTASTAQEQFEPETRLVALIIPFIIVPAGLLMHHSLTTHLTYRYGIEIRNSTSHIVGGAVHRL